MICSTLGHFCYNRSLLLLIIESGYFQEKDWLHYILIPTMHIFNGKEVVKGQAHTRWETAFVTNSMPSSHNKNKCQYSYAYTILHNPKKMYTSQSHVVGMNLGFERFRDIWLSSWVKHFAGTWKNIL
jgi:hypothetical protein